jgi:hypothetical protein
MNAVSPALSATLSLLPQQNQMTPKAELKMEDKPSSQSTSGGNSTVTLSEEALAQAKYSSGLKTEQTVQQAISPESRSIEANQTSSDLTYAANLQNTANVFSSKDEPVETEPKNT